MLIFPVFPGRCPGTDDGSLPKQEYRKGDKMKSITEVTKTKTRNVKNNRKNGKRYEGELARVE